MDGYGARPLRWLSVLVIPAGGMDVKISKFRGQFSVEMTHQKIMTLSAINLLTFSKIWYPSAGKIPFVVIPDVSMDCFSCRKLNLISPHLSCLQNMTGCKKHWHKAPCEEQQKLNIDKLNWKQKQLECEEGKRVLQTRAVVGQTRFNQKGNHVKWQSITSSAAR